jgi:hypothetical protein
MRCTQLIGLNGWARNFVIKNVVVHRTDTFPNGKVMESDIEVNACHSFEYDSAEYAGMFDDGPMLQAYFIDGHWYFEDVQCSPWSSGPMIYLALRDEKGEWIIESLHDDENEIGYNNDGSPNCDIPYPWNENKLSEHLNYVRSKYDPEKDVFNVGGIS